MKLTTGYKKPIASSGTDAQEQSSNNSYLLLAGGGHKALSELVSPADLTTELSNYVTIGSNQTITGVKTFSQAINAAITGNAATATNVDWSGVTNKPTSFPANGGNADYATAAGNAGTLSGHTADDFVLKTTHDVYESVIAESLNDLDNRKIEMSDIPTSLPASDVYDWAKAANKPSYNWSEINSRPTNVSEFENDAGYITDSDAKFGDYLSLSGGTVTGQLYLTGLEEGTADVTDNTELLTLYASNNGFSDTNATGKVYRRDAIKVYNYIKVKLDSVYSDIGHTHNTKEILDFPSSLPANGGNADTSNYAGYLRGRDVKGVYFGMETSSNIIAEWNTRFDNRWYLKAASTNQCRVEYADKVDWLGIDNKPSSFTPASHTHTTSEITNFPTIGNGRLILKNGEDLISDDFTANKVGDTTIDFNSKFINKSDFNLLGDKIDKIDTSIIELNNAIRVNNPFDDSGDDDEDTIESNDDMFGNNVVGSIDLRFYGITSEITLYIDLPVYFVNVAKICNISEVDNSISNLYNISITIDLTGTTIASTVGISSDTFKQFYIRGANINNNICGVDVRGNGTTNTATAIMSGNYLLLKCQLKLHGDKPDIGSFIMEEAKSRHFKAYLCLRQTI